MSTVKSERESKFSPSGGHLVLRLTANNALHAAGRLGVWDSSGETLLEQWTMAVSVAGSAEHTIGTPPDQLGDAFITWALLVCSHDANIDTGVVEVLVLQDQHDCVTEPVARYDLPEIPACEDGTAIPISDELQLRATQ